MLIIDIVLLVVTFVVGVIGFLLMEDYPRWIVRFIVLAIVDCIIFCLPI